MASLRQEKRWLKSMERAIVPAFEAGHWQTVKYLQRAIDRHEKKIKEYTDAKR